MNIDLSNWTPRPRPTREVLEGRFVRLEPLDPEKHGDGLYAVSAVPDAAQRFRWLGEHPPADRAQFQDWLAGVAAKADPFFHVVLDQRTDVVGGRQALMRIDQANGVIEIGSIYWGPGLSRNRGATEAFYLAACHVFERLGYRRLEWKCNAANEPSRKAAKRFGFAFEGLFRQHMVVKGENRDTAWFAMLDHEWPYLKRAFAAWLDPANFDKEGRQKQRLEELRR
ncbi:GNAT family protein [Nitratireductor sp. GISD-1A_MAKvit]|uniref:GNAT family N-acetyltransferase n=1 Tax=Nitratireductor sp. GISD-1A_MAKvit TaxID=3234198 RepID=UPI00346768E7